MIIVGLLTQFQANEDLQSQTYGLAMCGLSTLRQQVCSGEEPPVYHKGQEAYRVNHELLELWKRKMDIERALWAIFNLEGVVLRDLMDLLNKHHGWGLKPGAIQHISWYGEEKSRIEVICKRQPEQEALTPAKLDFTKLSAKPERLQLYWNVRHRWVHKHGLIDDAFREECEELFKKEGWFQFKDDRAWLTEAQMYQIRNQCVAVGKEILEQAIREYLMLRKELE